ncbi:MAG: flavodoxin family protein [Synergistaceae bacterium]|jgi:multimeric flavodoxin WrbA|nr:flavodoxin family protein [Synergistaceae bacterium]
MKKIVVFAGSPRENGTTARLIDEVIKGARSVGVEAKIYDLNADGVKGCQGCFYCKSHEGCATKDYLQPMYEDIKHADGIVFSSPIYFYDITGQAKIWVDRLFPVLAPDFKPRYPDKKVLALYSQGNEDASSYQKIIQKMQGIFSGFGWTVTESILCFGTTVSGDAALTDDLLERAFAAGAALVA